MPDQLDPFRRRPLQDVDPIAILRLLVHGDTDQAVHDVDDLRREVAGLREELRQLETDLGAQVTCQAATLEALERHVRELERRQGAG